MITNSVSVYRRGEQGFYIHASAYTDMGVLVAVPPFVQVANLEVSRSLGRAVLNLLMKPAERVPHPKAWNLLAPMLEMAQCKNWKQFARKAKFCAVDLVRGDVIVRRGVWDGKGFDSTDQESLNLGTGPAETLVAETVLRILK